ncbi:MAG TPA: IS5/IS1182 family transposase, partial [Bradyrhizobium sp.]|nr:IS5/IS1182 family transposase [Bradyrhizobium sp.]
MADEQLFEDLPEQERPQAEVRGALRLRVPERSQIGMQVAALDDLIS